MKKFINKESVISSYVEKRINLAKKILELKIKRATLENFKSHKIKKNKKKISKLCTLVNIK